MRGGLRLFALGWAMTLLGGLLAHCVQTAGGVTIKDVRYQGAGGTRLSALLYVPPGATPSRPAPAVMVSHGYINTREMQSPFAIELARRGFVVLAIDMAGHGYSDGAVGDHDGGGPDGLKYLQHLAFVDQSNIGLEGHSMGGVPVVGAALAQPDGYRAMVLEGSTTPEIGQLGADTPKFPRNVAVVFGQFDEFAPLMWREAKGSSVNASPKLKRLFGTAQAVIPGRLYGSITRGTARLLVNPPITHPMEHFSAAGVGAAVYWFQSNLSGAASPKPPGDQIWLWKELGTLIALVGFVVLLLGTFELLLATRMFAALRQPAVAPTVRRAGRWWLALALTAFVPALSFYPLMTLGFAFLPSALFPQWVANQIVVWALANSAFSLILAFVLRGERPIFTRRWGLSAVIAVLTVATGYLSLVVVDVLFKVDFRFWVVGLKPLDGRHFGFGLAYLGPLTIVFLVMMRSLHANLAITGQSAAKQYLTAATALAFGFVVLLVAQYASLLSTGLLITPDQALNTIIAIQFAPLLAVVGLIGAFTYRRTGGYVPGALICAMVVTWYIVAGTATHWSPGWTVPKMTGLYPSRPAMGVNTAFAK